MKADTNNFLVGMQNTKGYKEHRGSIVPEKRIRPWQKQGFKSKKEWLYMKNKRREILEAITKVSNFLEDADYTNSKMLVNALDEIYNYIEAKETIEEI